MNRSQGEWIELQQDGVDGTWKLKLVMEIWK